MAFSRELETTGTRGGVHTSADYENDACYTMQLLVSLLHAQHESLPDSSPETLARLHAIAQNPMPLERVQETRNKEEAEK